MVNGLKAAESDSFEFLKNGLDKPFDVASLSEEAVWNVINSAYGKAFSWVPRAQISHLSSDASCLYIVEDSKSANESVAIPVCLAGLIPKFSSILKEKETVIDLSNEKYANCSMHLEESGVQGIFPAILTSIFINNQQFVQRDLGAKADTLAVVNKN